MPPPDTTDWEMILSSARGNPVSRAVFAARYERLIRDYLGNRWRGTHHLAEIDDAIQEVFFECFKEGGVLERADPARKGGFRAFLFGVVRNVTLRVEDRCRRNREVQSEGEPDPERPAPDRATASSRLDREWAQAILHEAVRRMAEEAAERGEEALRRVEILRLRFEEGLPIREIARRWQAELIPLHQQYTKARREFRTVLCEMLFPGRKAAEEELQRELDELSRLLGEA